MNYDILLGPILGYEWDNQESAGYYTVIVRVSAGAAPRWVVDDVEVAMVAISPVLGDQSRVYRGEVRAQFAAGNQDLSYGVMRGAAALANICGDKSWEFRVPGLETLERTPRIAFCSCNGVSDSRDLAEEPLALWQRMEKLHRKERFSLLLMGGDQLYCDDIARREGSLARIWKWLSKGERAKVEPSQEEFLRAYMDHYLDGWVRAEGDEKIVPFTAMINMMAQVPSVMMWDDHDIFDGWGSYQAKDHKQPYYKSAFQAARTAFGIYQIRGESANRSLLDRGAASPRSFTQGLRFGSYSLLVMDNRSTRTPEIIMDDLQWEQLLDWLAAVQPAAPEGIKTTLLVVSPVPVVYRRFQDWITQLPGEHGGEDDLRDHWSHVNHEGERAKLISHLFSSLKYSGNAGKFDRVTLLSGDVHVGALGYLERTDAQAEIAQIISSGILHKPPTAVQWLGLKAVSDDEEHTIRGQSVVAKMARPLNSCERYLVCRNFTWMKAGNDGKLWANWECEPTDDKMPELVYVGLR